MDKRKQSDENEEIEFANQKISDINMEREVRKSFIEYSMSVIMSRALPDVRDGMKPGQRRILYAMYEDHLTHDRAFYKSATTVGNVLGRYHPHGDAAVYGSMVRMAQTFSYRYTLIDGHGNFGSVDGDPPAAYRYTEARLSGISDEMMRDLDKEVVKFVPNFDNRRREPTVLPSRFPNLLVNGSVGIAVGMATNIPPHNLGEVIDATIYRMDNPDCTVPELMQFIKGPDFPTAAMVYGVNGIIEAYTTGKGRINVRARANVEEENHRIIVTEIPYMVNKSLLCEAIAQLVKDKKIEGITDMHDESSSKGMRIVIDYRRDANGQVILNQLYRYTQLQDTCSVNMLAIVNNEPKILPLPAILDIYIQHQESVITNRTKFDLDKALARAHIYEGYHIALDNIDRIIEIMKTSPSVAEAKERLMSEFFTVNYSDEFAAKHGIENGSLRQLTDEQAQAIVDMTLGKLTGMERQKIEDELLRLHNLIDELEEILADIGKVKQIIKDEMTEIKRKYGDERRTEIIPYEDDIVNEDLIERHKCVVTVSHEGYIKRVPADTYTAQHRGGKGIMGMTAKEDDFIEKVSVVNSHSNLLLFTDAGKVYSTKAYRLHECSRTSKGTNIVNVVGMEPGEKLTAMIAIDEFTDDKYLIMVTKRGIVKKTLLSEFEHNRKNGKFAINLDEGDKLIYVMLSDGTNELMIATSEGLAVRFSEEKIRSMGRTAHGVIGIRLKDCDYVVGVALVEEGKTLLTVTENGFGKKSSFDDYRQMKNKGGSGVTCQKITEKTGKLIGILPVDENDDIMLITDGGTIIRIESGDISTFSRTAAGVIIMRASDGEKVANFTKVARDDDIEEELEKLPDVPAEPAEKVEKVITKLTDTSEDEDIKE